MTWFVLVVNSAFYPSG